MLLRRGMISIQKTLLNTILISMKKIKKNITEYFSGWKGEVYFIFTYVKIYLVREVSSFVNFYY